MSFIDKSGMMGFDFNYIVRLQGRDAPDDQDTKTIADRLFNKPSLKDKSVLLDWDPRGDEGNIVYIKGKTSEIPPLGENTRLYLISHGNVGENSTSFKSQPKMLRFNIVNWNPGHAVAGFHGGSSGEDMQVTASSKVSSFSAAIGKTKLFKTLGFPDRDSSDQIRKIGRISIVACNIIDPGNYSETGVEFHGFANKLHQQLVVRGIETEVVARFGIAQADPNGTKSVQENNGRIVPVKSRGMFGKVIFKGNNSQPHYPNRSMQMDLS